MAAACSVGVGCDRQRRAASRCPTAHAPFVPPPRLAGALDGRTVCHASVSFLLLVLGVLLPTLFTMIFWRPPTAPTAAPAVPEARLARAVWRAGEALAAVDRWVREVLPGPQPSAMRSAFLVYYAAVCMWWTARALGGLL